MAAGIVGMNNPSIIIVREPAHADDSCFCVDLITQHEYPGLMEEAMALQFFDDSVFVCVYVCT
jgi:hypothetical protein